MKSLFLAGSLAALVSATSYSISVYAPGTAIDGALLNAAGNAFFTGISDPATYCPNTVANCPTATETLVTAGFEAMAVEVAGGQTIYVGPDGVVHYTQAHSKFMPTGSYVGSMFDQTVVSACQPTTNVINFLTPDGSNVGGIMLCPDVPSYMTGTGASYQLFAKTPALTQTNCVAAVGIKLQESAAQVGSYQYL